MFPLAIRRAKAEIESRVRDDYVRRVSLFDSYQQMI